MYYIKQTEGKLADAADQFFSARRDGATLNELKKIYRDATGKEFPESVKSTSDCWVISNATSAIRNSYNFEKVSKRVKCNPLSEEKWAYWAARAAEKVHGGVWQHVYEY